MDLHTAAPILPPADEKGLTRAEGLWFADGGLIIRAETTLFRLSRDFLAARSPVFADMVSLPTPKNVEMMNGCPFVFLTDSAKDLATFLKALIYSDFFESFPAPTTFSDIASVLRMSHKYEVDYLRKRALIHLSAVCPTTLLEWERFDSTTCSWFPDTDVEYLDLILLARQTSANWILPTAFYRLCQHVDEDSIINGANLLELTSSDKVACMRAIRTLETTCTTRVLEFLSTPLHIKGCHSVMPLRCAYSRIKTRFAAESWRQYEAAKVPFLPLELWSISDWDRAALADVCRNCMSFVKEAHKEAKQDVWDRLPALFGLCDWRSLEKLKTEAL
ncbi:hypothetical protein B0H14DRAFT_3013857, partial [Mycena olivaceomarginata]